MAGQIGGAQLRGGNNINGAGQLGGIQQGGGDAQALQQIKQIFEQILKMLQGGGEQAQAQGAKGGQQAGGGQEAGGANGGKSLQELLEELQRLAQQNPEALKQALQNPAFMQVAQAALSGGGGGGAVGKAA
jgi:hypothetical protein